MGGYNRPNPGRGGGPPRGNPGYGRGAQGAPTLPTAQSVTYFDGEGNLRAALMEQEAQRVAESLGDQKMKASQLRRFYDDVVSLRRRLDLESSPGEQGREAAFNALRAEFKMLKAKAVYANGRDRGKTFPEAMLQFVIDHVAAVNSAKDFDAFWRHLQAVVAFHKFYAPKE